MTVTTLGRRLALLFGVIAFNCHADIATLVASKDAMIQSSNPTTNYGSFPEMMASGSNPGGSASFGIFDFDLSTIPSNATINSVSLQLTFKDRLPANTQTATKLFYWSGASNWSESSVTWQYISSMSGYDETLIDTVLGSFGNGAVWEWSNSVLRTVIANRINNPGSYGNIRGFELVGTIVDQGNIFYTREATTTSYRPKLIIDYTPPQQVATPSISPASGAYGAPLTVTISCDTAGATIRYTDNGNEPTEQSTIIASGSQIQVNPPVTIKAKAWKAGMTASETAVRVYALQQQSQVATPNISPASGTYGAPLMVTISCDTSGATIRYTDNGNEPTEQSTIIASGSQIQVSPPVTIKAKAWKSGMTASNTAVRDYTLQQQGQVATPSISPASGAYGAPLTVTISCDTAGSTIRYTDNGNEPTEQSTIIASGSQIQVSPPVTIKAKAWKSGMTASNTAVRDYTLQQQQTSLRVLSPNSGENWIRGNKYKMTWTSAGNVGSTVRLELRRNGNWITGIKDTTPNDGKQRWRVKGWIAAGTGYKIRVVSISNPSVWDETDVAFSISSSKANRLRTPPGN